MRKIFVILAILAFAITAIILIRRLSPIRTSGIVTVQGSVLRRGDELMTQTPLADATITASDKTTNVVAKSDASGYFSFQFNRGLIHNSPVLLRFTHSGFAPLEINTGQLGDQLYIARMQPQRPALPAGTLKLIASGKPVQVKPIQLKNIQVRYSFKNESTLSVGSFAKQFEAPNLGNVPCASHKPCSPDGRWKATETILPIDAGEGNTFRSVRVSCLAGPCAFTRVQPNDDDSPERKVNVSVLNWSDKADFLIEADVTRTMTTDQVRQIYPFIVGQTMNFALPPGSKGPSIEGDLDGQYTVFPLGPTNLLSWADCSVEISPATNQIFRCQLKPGYTFQ